MRFVCTAVTSWTGEFYLLIKRMILREGNRMTRILLLLTTVLILSGLIGCAVPQYNYMPSRTQISEPPLGSVNVAHVGDNMLRQGSYTEYDALYLPANAPVSWAYTLTTGYYIKRGEDKDSEFYQPTNDGESGNVIKAAIADPWKSVQAYKNEQSLCVVTVFNVHVCDSKYSYERRKKSLLQGDSFQQTLIYSGRVGNKINVGYREFSNSLARPAFNNNVEYDLNESSIIGYKGARLEILEATNEFIRYRVIENFNKAQF